MSDPAPTSPPLGRKRRPRPGYPDGPAYDAYVATKLHTPTLAQVRTAAERDGVTVATWVRRAIYWALAFSAVLLVTGGCAVQRAERFAIDGFTAAQTATIEAALEEWRYQGAVLEYYRGPADPGDAEIVPSDHCTYPQVGTTELRPLRAPRVLLCTGSIGTGLDRLYLVAVHEIGHALAGHAGHLERASDGVMAAQRPPGSPAEITRQDVALVLGGER